MVWNSTQSALYKAVARHNGEDFSEENNCCEDSVKIPENSTQKNDKICAENTDNNYTENTDKKCCKDSVKIPEKLSQKNDKNCSENTDKNCCKDSAKIPENSTQKNDKNCAENTDKNYNENTFKNYRKNNSGNCPKKSENMGSDKSRNCGKFDAENCTKKCGKCGSENCQKKFTGSREMPRVNNANNPLTKLFSDSDFLLIAALIYILSKNGADQKIILALVFVLIS